MSRSSKEYLYPIYTKDKSRKQVIEEYIADEFTIKELKRNLKVKSYQQIGTTVGTESSTDFYFNLPYGVSPQKALESREKMEAAIGNPIELTYTDFKLIISLNHS